MNRTITQSRMSAVLRRLAEPIARTTSRLAVGAVVTLAVAAASTPSHAGFVYTTTDLGTTGGQPAQEQYKETITTGGSTNSGFDIHWHVDAGTNGLPAGQYIDGTAHVSVISFTNDDIQLSVSITNNSNFPTAKIVDFGFDVDPAVTGESISGGTVFTNVSSDSVPGFQEVDVCAYAGSGCSGGGNSGLADGASDNFTIELTAPAFTFGPDDSHLSVALEYLVTKWQGNQPLSFELSGVPKKTTEPGSLLILGTALVGLGLLRRRRNRLLTAS